MSKNPCVKCNAYCCRHVALGIDTPVDEEDFDCIRWYLLHKNVWVAILPDDSWLIEFKTPCRKIVNNRCADYAGRPNICKEYPEEGQLCEGETTLPACKELFKSVRDLERYLSKRR